MLPEIVATTFTYPTNLSPGGRMRSQRMNKKLISSCFHCRFSITPAVIRCYFTRQNPKLITKSTCCLIGGENFPVLTAKYRGNLSAPRTVAGSRFTLHGSRLTIHPLLTYEVPYSIVEKKKEFHLRSVHLLKLQQVFGRNAFFQF